MKVYGTVYDETGDIIPGANIASAAYPNIVVASDINGKFELDNEKITSISPIKISYVGYKDKFIVAKDLQGAKVNLQDDIITLNEVIVRPKPKDTTAAAVVPADNKFKDHLKKYQGPYIVLLSMAIITVGVFTIKKVA